MDDRDGELQKLVADLETHGAVDAAFLATSFTDRLVVVDINGGGDVPADVLDRLAEHDLHGADEVYGDDLGGSFAGDVGDITRHHFVDVQTRGSHQSYVKD